MLQLHASREGQIDECNPRTGLVLTGGTVVRRLGRWVMNPRSLFGRVDSFEEDPRVALSSTATRSHHPFPIFIQVIASSFHRRIRCLIPHARCMSLARPDNSRSIITTALGSPEIRSPEVDHVRNDQYGHDHRGNASIRSKCRRAATSLRVEVVRVLVGNRPPRWEGRSNLVTLEKRDGTC